MMMPFLIHAEIIESPTTDTVLEAIQKSPHKKILVAFDIDNTILRPTTQLGSEAWEDYGIEELQRKGISKEDAELVQNILWVAVQPSLTVVPVDPNVSKVIQKLQSSNIPVLALTARTTREVGLTKKQLENVGVDLSRQWKNYPASLDMSEAVFSDGVLYTSFSNKKSDVLFKFLQKHHLEPDLIIFVDNKSKHVNDISQAAQKRKIDYLGIRLNTTDDIYRSYDPEIGDAQWKAFPKILSDEEAQKQVEESQAVPL